MSRFFTSDLHFFHKRITELTNRGLETTAEDHTDWLIDKINSQVQARDTLVSLGDFSFSNLAKTTEVLDRLNCCNIVLISGNHDRFQPESARVWYKEISIAGVTTILSHFAFESWHKQHHGSYHLHGHSHGSLPPRGRRIDVGLDNAYQVLGEHRLFTEDEVHELLGKSPIYVADQHRDCNQLHALLTPPKSVL